MKNVPIKFRGQQLTADKDFVYGDLIQYPYDLPIIRVFDDEECKKGLYSFDDYEVYPESVAQLVGYDAEGNEVYEGDKLKFCGNPESYRYVQAYDEARITAGLESSDLPLSEYKLTSEDEFYNWQYNIHTGDYE